MNKNIVLKSLLYLTSFFTIASLIGGCADPSVLPAPNNGKELITTLKIELTDTITGKKLNYFFRDLDGLGGKAPSQWDTLNLTDSSYYRMSLKILNESNPNAVEDISQEIYVERSNHIICYTPQMANVVIKRTDSDGTYDLGLTSNWKTGNASQGDITIVLKHQPGSKNGGCSNGETDVEVKFFTVIY